MKKLTKLEKQERIAEICLICSIVICMLVFIGALIWPLVDALIAEGSRALYTVR